MPYRVEGVEPSAIGEYWSIVSPMLLPALERDDDNLTVGDLFDLIAKRRAMLWIVRDEEVIGALVVMLKPTYLLVWLMGGNSFDEWHEAVEGSLLRYAKENQREKVVAVVRPGLGRKLKNWRKTQETVELHG